MPVNPARDGRRCGVTLVELLVALPVAALIAALAVALLLAAGRQARQSDGALSASRELRHAVTVVTSELRPLAATDVAAASDTSLDFDALVGSGVVCDGRATPRSITLLPDAGSSGDPAGTRWLQPVQDGDQVQLWLAPRAPALSPVPFVATMQRGDNVPGCAGSPLRWNGVAATRLTLYDSLPGAPMHGTPVRVTRRVRYSLYRASDALWYLGRRTRSGATWDVIQPVVGPLRSAAQLGVRFEMRDTLGVVAAAPSGSLGAIRLSVRAARSSTTTDSLTTGITFRGHLDE